MKYKLILVLLCLGGMLQAQDVQLDDTLELDLEACRVMAVENSEVVKIAAATMTKAEHEKGAAHSAYFPSIKASAIGIYNEQSFDETVNLPTQNYDPVSGQLVPNIATDLNDNPIMGPDGVPIFNTYAYLPINIGMYGGITAGVSAEQALYAGGKISAANQMANIGSSLASDNKELKRVETIYETDQMYYLCLATYEKVVLAKSYRSLLLQLYDNVNDAYDMGMSSYNDVLKVKVKLNEVIMQEHQAESGLALARMSLCRILGLPLHTPIRLSRQVQLDDTSMALAAQEVDVTHRVEYQLLDKQVKLAEQKVKMIQGDYRPTAGVSVGYNYYNVDLKNFDNYDESGFSLSAKLEIPITTFGERRGKVNAEKSELLIRELELQRASGFLALEVEQARMSWTDALLRCELAEEGLEQAEENRRISQDSYDLGMTTIVDLLESQAAWQEAYSHNIDANVEFKLKESNFLKVTNKL